MESRAAILVHLQQRTGYVEPVPAWLWPNLLSLDAPIVAGLWQILFARCFHVELSIVPVVLLMITVWLIYTADRVFDVWRGDGGTLRHQFYARNCRSLAPVWVLALISTAALALRALPQELFERGVLVLLLVAVYLFLVHKVVIRHDIPGRPSGLKEATVGAVFAMGSSLIVWSKVRTAADVAAILLFAGLCWMNCAAIRGWENDAAKSVALGYFELAIVGFCLGDYGLLFFHRPVLGGAEIMSAGALLLLHFARRSLSRNALRVLADVALLTPVILLPVAGWV